MLPADPVRFAAAARRLGGEARRRGLVVPGFRSPPRLPGAERSIRRRPDGAAVVAVRVHGRSLEAVVADMVEGVLAANRLTAGRGGRSSARRCWRPSSGRRRHRRRDRSGRSATTRSTPSAGSRSTSTTDLWPGLLPDDYLAELADVRGRAEEALVLVAVDDEAGTVLGGITYVDRPGRWASIERARPGRAAHAGGRPRGPGPGRRHRPGAGLHRPGPRSTASARSPSTPPTVMAAAQRIYERAGFRRRPERRPRTTTASRCSATSSTSTG